MLQEVLNHLQPRPGGIYVDATLGGGGHAAAILSRIVPNGRLHGCDRDGDAIETCRRRLAEWSGNLELHHGSYACLTDWIGLNSADGVLMDLGVSSYQLDRRERGFSFRLDGPIDMRMDQRLGTTAADVINRASVGELAAIFRDLGEERDARRLAGLIVEERQKADFLTTQQLAGFIEKVSRTPKGKSRKHPATLIFQGLRMHVNNELAELEAGLDAAYKILKPNGLLLLITFHSLEARQVKQFGKRMTRDYTYEGDLDVPEMRIRKTPQMQWVIKKAQRPSPTELTENPRARSAQLRVLKKLEHPCL